MVNLLKSFSGLAITKPKGTFASIPQPRTQRQSLIPKAPFVPALSPNLAQQKPVPNMFGKLAVTPPVLSPTQPAPVAGLQQSKVPAVSGMINPPVPQAPTLPPTGQLFTQAQQAPQPLTNTQPAVDINAALASGGLQVQPSGVLPPQAPIKPYTVQAGDTLGAIAQKFGVPITAISGYQSGDPNRIIPGETLSIGGQPVTSGAQPVQQPSQAPSLGVPQGDTAQVAQDQVIQDLATQNPELADMVANTLGYSSSAQPQLVEKYGIDPQSLQTGFNTNPVKTVKDLVKEVMESTGLPDITSKVEGLVKQIEELSNERDDEIQKINDNPFISAGTKNERIRQLSDRYELKIKNRTASVQLLQDTYADARQEAQFAATTAINLYDKNRNFDQSRLEFFMEQAEKAQAAQKGLDKKGFELSEGQIRYEYNAKTGKYEAVASGGAKPLSATAEAKLIEKAEQQDTATQQAGEAIGLVNSILPNAGAISGPIQTGSIPFTKGSPAVNQYEQLKALLALGKRALLKGSGAISDYEAGVLQKASSELGRNLKEDQFSTALKKVRGVLRTNSGLDTEVIIVDSEGNQLGQGLLSGQDIYEAVIDGNEIIYL